MSGCTPENHGTPASARRPPSHPGSRRSARGGLAAALALLIGLTAALGFGAPAQAQEQKRRQRVIRLDAITVEGRIQKPQAIYILQRSILNFAELERTESFLPKIVQSVDKDCF